MEARTYRSLAARRSGDEAAVLLALAEAEGRHEAHWLELLGPYAYPDPKPPLSLRIHSTLAHIFGAIFILAMAQRAEQRSTYHDDDDATDQMAADEQIHGEVIRSLIAHHRQALAGTFRAAVFGANDGLVSSLALILGIAATGVSPTFVALTGVAGLLAGALSMAAGEWVSVQSQRELLDASIPDPKAHQSLTHLDVNANELALVFRARGESEEAAQAHVATVFEQIQTPATTDSAALAIRTVLADTAGVTSGVAEEVGTPWKAAMGSFVFFSIGALVPLLPFLFGLSGLVATVVSLVLVGMALLFTGGVVGVLSGVAPLPRALRQLFIGYGAAAVTYLLGWLFGVSIV